MSDRLKELRQKRGKIVGEMRVIMNRAEAARRDLTTEELSQHGKLYGEQEQLADEIQAVERQVEIDREAAAAQAAAERGQPYRRADRADGGAAGAGVELWYDSEGREIPVFSADASIADYVAQRSGQAHEPPLSLGRYCRALVLGPRNDAEKRALLESTGPGGGYAVGPRVQADILDLLRANDALTQAGVRTALMPSPETTIVRHAADPAVTWHGEATTITEDSAMSFGAINMYAKKLTCLVKVTRELFDDAANIEEAVRNAIAKAVMLEIQRVAFYGAGALQPVGLVSQASGDYPIGTVDMGDNGGLLNYDRELDAYETIITANSAPPNAIIYHPREQVALARLIDGEGQWLRPPDLLQNLRRFQTSAILINETKGTAENASRAFVADWSQMLIGYTKELRVELLRELFAQTYQFGLLAHVRLDIATLQEDAFCQLHGIIPAT